MSIVELMRSCVNRPMAFAFTCLAIDAIEVLIDHGPKVPFAARE